MIRKLPFCIAFALATSANAQPPTEPVSGEATIPLTYVGSNARVSLGVNDDGDVLGQLGGWQGRGTRTAGVGLGCATRGSGGGHEHEASNASAVASTSVEEGAPVEEFAGGVEVAGVAGGLGDDVQHQRPDIGQVHREALGERRRNIVAVQVGDDRVGLLDLLAVEGDHLVRGELAGWRAPEAAGVLRIARPGLGLVGDHAAEPESLVIGREVVDQLQDLSLIHI